MSVSKQRNEKKVFNDSQTYQNIDTNNEIKLDKNNLNNRKKNLRNKYEQSSSAAFKF